MWLNNYSVNNFQSCRDIASMKFTGYVLGKLVVSLMLYVIINRYRHADMLLQFYKDFYQHLTARCALRYNHPSILQQKVICMAHGLTIFFWTGPELVGQSIINFNCMYEQTIYFSRPQWVMNVSGLGTKIAGEG